MTLDWDRRSRSHPADDPSHWPFRDAFPSLLTTCNISFLPYTHIQAWIGSVFDPALERGIFTRIPETGPRAVQRVVFAPFFLRWVKRPRASD